MTELTDLSDTDANNTAVTGQSTVGSVANMGGMDNLFQATLGMLSRFRNSNIFQLRDNSDNTKKLAFDLSGLTTATTRTLTVPDANGVLALRVASTSDNAIVRFDGATGAQQSSSATISDAGLLTATTFSGSGASLTSIPSSAVTRTANAVGTYGILANSPHGFGSHGPGGTAAGSSLAYAGLFGDNALKTAELFTSSTVFPAGTWQCMGRHVNTTSGQEWSATLWVRIA